MEFYLYIASIICTILQTIANADTHAGVRAGPPGSERRDSGQRLTRYMTKTLPFASLHVTYYARGGHRSPLPPRDCKNPRTELPSVTATQPAATLGCPRSRGCRLTGEFGGSRISLCQLSSAAGEMSDDTPQHAGQCTAKVCLSQDSR